MKENQKELDELIQEVMEQMRERRYGKDSYTLSIQFSTSYDPIT